MGFGKTKWCKDLVWIKHIQKLCKTRSGNVEQSRTTAEEQLQKNKHRKTTTKEQPQKHKCRTSAEEQLQINSHRCTPAKKSDTEEQLYFVPSIFSLGRDPALCKVCLFFKSCLLHVTWLINR